MKLLLCLLLGTALALFEEELPAAGEPRRRLSKGSTYEQREKNKKCLANFKADARKFPNLLNDVANMDKAVRHARGIVHDCPVFDAERSVVIKRPWKGESMIYTTDNPRNCYDELMKWIKNRRTKPENTDDDHRLKLVHYYKTRDGKSRRMLIIGDMDLWAAFLLQQDHFTVELQLEVVATEVPSSAPTTQTPTIPTLSPTKPSNPSFILAKDAQSWIKSLLPKGMKLADNPCYRSSVAGRTKALLWLRTCGNGYNSEYDKQKPEDKRGNGPWIFTIRTSNGMVFGGYNDLNWTRGDGYRYCEKCFLWVWKERTTSYAKKKYTIKRYANYATYHNTSYGPCYGGGHDMCISSPTAQSGYTNMGHTWNAPNGGYPYYLAISSSSSFYINEWEVTPVVPEIDGDFYTRIAMSSYGFNYDNDRKWMASLLPSGKKFGPHCYNMKYGIGKSTKSITYMRRLCGNKGPLMITIRTSNGRVFGGYMGVGMYGWDSGSKSSVFFKDPSAFLFILKDKTYTRKKLTQYRHTEKAIYHNNSYGPCFGGAHDLCINLVPKGIATWGYTYTSPSGNYPYYPDSGSSGFTIDDWEAHIIIPANSDRQN